MFGSAFKHTKRIGLFGGCLTIGVVVIQGYTLRIKYKNSEQLEPPIGPTKGIEKFLSKVNTLKADLHEKTEDLIKSVKKTYQQKVVIKTDGTMFESRPTFLNDSKDKFWKQSGQNRNIQNSNKKIKLLILGDSLVAGVGCDKEECQSSPVLPKVIAQALNRVLSVDIEWKACGIIGGSVQELREAVSKREEIAEFLKHKKNDENYENIEHVVVIICGLNDWRIMLENFPFGHGPENFRCQLKDLIYEIKANIPSTQSSRFFLPSLPFNLVDSDPKWMFKTAPLSYVVSSLSNIWDRQKYFLADEASSTSSSSQRENMNKDLNSKTQDITTSGVMHAIYVGNPSFKAAYATPGMGNLSADGVHPSSQGYRWWALHIAEAIATNNR